MQGNRLLLDDTYASAGHGLMSGELSQQQMNFQEMGQPPLSGNVPCTDLSNSWSELERLSKDKAAAADTIKELQNHLAEKVTFFQLSTFLLFCDGCWS